LICQAQIDAYRRDGAIKLSAAFDVSWLERLRAGVDENFASPSQHACRYTAPGEPGGFYDDYCNWTRIDSYREFIEDSPAAQMVGLLMQSSEVRIFHEHVLVKEPGTRERTPWHHDLPYYCVEGTQLCSIWLPLDPVPKAACVEFVAGSHALGERYVPRKFVSQEAYGEAVSGYLSVPDIDAERAQYELLSWDMAPGDCIVFHMATLHGAAGTSDLRSRRRAFSTRWLGDDARYATRPWEMSPPFPEVRIRPGQPMEHALFPVLWRR
jgi:ectoine hydroxylase-related dioxygenase (phytanoyl-CoA dioxygenase family)